MQNKKPMLHITPIDYLKIAKQISEDRSTIEYEKDGFILTIIIFLKLRVIEKTIISMEQEVLLKHHEISEYMM